MALRMNYGGLTYAWYYGQMVEVYDGKRLVDAFTLGGFGDYSYTDFLDAVYQWERYISDNASYLLED